jgi:hypothetical protein
MKVKNFKILKLCLMIKIKFIIRKFCIKNIFFFKHYFSPLNTLMSKGKDSDPRGPKTYGDPE